jgi:hypothetical protein
MPQQMVLDEAFHGQPDVRCRRCAGDAVPTVRAAILSLGDTSGFGPTTTFRELKRSGLLCRQCSPPNLASLQRYHIRQDEDLRALRARQMSAK